MKHVSLLTPALFMLSSIVFLSCKKDKSEPTPSSPQVNQVSTTAPYLDEEFPTTLSNFVSEANYTYYLSEIIIEPQGDDWSIMSINSSNTNVATVSIKPGSNDQDFIYTAIAAGTTTFTIVVADEDGNRNTLAFTLTVTVVEEEVAVPVNQAPTMSASFSFNILQGGSNTHDFSTSVSDPQNDIWSITSVSSSNTSVATVSISSGNDKQITYTGRSVGNATLTVTVSDEYNHSNSYNIPITVSPMIVIAQPI